jgi:hypothetical protein
MMKTAKRRDKMPTIQVNALLSPEEIVKSLDQLSTPDLEGVVMQVLALRAHRKASSLPHNEAELLIKINQGLPPDIHARYAELITKRQEERLTPEEYQELLQLTAQVEQFEAQRVAYLAELAQLRQTSLTALMEDLHIPSPAYV